jgi:hypothetical protein
VAVSDKMNGKLTATWLTVVTIIGVACLGGLLRFYTNSAVMDYRVALLEKRADFIAFQVQYQRDQDALRERFDRLEVALVKSGLLRRLGRERDA